MLRISLTTLVLSLCLAGYGLAEQGAEDKSWKEKYDIKVKATNSLSSDPAAKKKPGLEYKLKDNVSLKADPKSQERGAGLSANVKTSPDTSVSAGAGYKFDNLTNQQGVSRPGNEKTQSGANAGLNFNVSF